MSLLMNSLVSHRIDSMGQKGVEILLLRYKNKPNNLLPIWIEH